MKDSDWIRYEITSYRVIFWWYFRWWHFIWWQYEIFIPITSHLFIPDQFPLNLDNFHTTYLSPSEYISYQTNFEIISDHLSVTVWNTFIWWHFRWWRSDRFYHPLSSQSNSWGVKLNWNSTVLSHFKENMIFFCKY